VSVRLHIERLRTELSLTGISGLESQYICDEAEDRINEVILSVVSNAVNSAIDYAISIGANDFVEDVRIVPDSNGLYQISTHSGILDYSKPEQQMLSKLLTNANVSADGHRYKVIPIEQKENRVEQSMFSMLQNRQNAIDNSRAALREQASNRKLDIGSALRESIAQQASAARAMREVAKSKTGHTEFRTASDRQDPLKAWVIPEKEADMTDYIQDVNEGITNQSNQAISEIMDSYYSSYGR
jgi:hypothetical protein